MSTVRIPPTLRTATGGAKQVEVPGGTVRDVVTSLVAAYPGLESQLLAPDGDLNRFVNAFLNDTDVRHLQSLDTPVRDGDTLVLLPRWPAADPVDPATWAVPPSAMGWTTVVGVSERVDVAIIGGGIVGLATALKLLEQRPALRIAILEKEPHLAMHQSGHNSGVVHAGLYYAPGSLKATLCREGKAALEVYAEAHGIPIRYPGKLVVALSEDELPRLASIHERATANGVDGLEEVGPERIRELEPKAAGDPGLWSPRTGIVDFRAVALAYAADLRTKGVAIHTGREVTGIDPRSGEVVLTTTTGELLASNVIACAGLQSDRVAAMTGETGRDIPRIVPFRGDYYTLKPEARSLVTRLLYPVPDPRFPFLGVHFTPRHDGAVWAGPNAVLALAREGYKRTDTNVRDLAETLSYRGFQRVALKFWRMGAAEMWRDIIKRAYVREMQRYLPEIRGDQLRFGPSGVRAQVLAHDGTLVDDFSLGGSGRLLHVRNAPSPAATSSLAIGRMLAETAIDRFALA